MPEMHSHMDLLPYSNGKIVPSFISPVIFCIWKNPFLFSMYSIT